MAWHKQACKVSPWRHTVKVNGPGGTACMSSEWVKSLSPPEVTAVSQLVPVQPALQVQTPFEGLQVPRLLQLRLTQRSAGSIRTHDMSARKIPQNVPGQGFTTVFENTVCTVCDSSNRGPSLRHALLHMFLHVAQSATQAVGSSAKATSWQRGYTLGGD